jgi:HD-GYP domain-containing protein (c-di-GMP phosphodiesterase class II)
VALGVLGAFGGVFGAAYVLVGPVILPLIFVTFLVGQMGFHSYSQLRGAHLDTIRGFVKALEALDPYTRGHTERVARFSRQTAQRLEFSADRLEKLEWAALIHDVGKVAVPAELLHKPGSLTDDEYRRMVRHMLVVEDVLAGVDFLAPMVEIAAAHHSLLEGASRVSVEGRILAAADAFDAMTSTRSYRAAVTQSTAFDQLRRRGDVYGVEVVEALIAAIEASGEQYGSPDDESSAEVERLVRERAIRA